MKICVTSQGEGLGSLVDPRFGRCAFFVIVDTDTMQSEAISNENAQTAGGAGIRSGQLMADKGIKIVLTGNVGPNAFQTLNAAGIQIITGASGTVKDAVELFKKGDMNPTQNPTSDPKSGLRA